MSKLISRNNNIIKYKAPSQKIEPQIRLTDDDLMQMGWQRLYYDNDPNHRQVKDDDPLRKTLDADESDWWVGDLQGNLVPKEAVLNYWNTKNTPSSNATLEKGWEDRASELTQQEVEKEQQHRRNKQFNKDVDTVFIKAPLTLLGSGIGGAVLAPWLTSALATPTGQALMYGSLGGEALNFTSQLEGYDNFGHLIYNAGGGENWRNLPEWQKTLWNFTNPGYLISGPASKAVNLTVEGLQRNALNNTFKGISINPTTKDLAKAINTEVKNKQFTNLFPGQIGWAPRQTLTGYHASNKPIQEFNYWHPNWAVIEHDAPYGVYFTANETRPSGGFLAKRPYIEQVTSTFDKPMVQVGEISTAGKNATRNSIERQAQSMGADGIIYQGIKDNQLENQTIVKTLNPDQEVNVSEIIENDPYQVTKILDKDKIRLRLPTHTKDLPREIVLEPQGNNQYRIHIRTWNGDHVPANLDSKEKQALFESVYNELPEGAEILFPESSIDYPATRGTVAALMRLSRDPRFQRGNTTGTLTYTDKNGNLQTFTGNSFIKRQEPMTRLYRVTGTSGKFEPSIDGTEQYTGMWFTDSPTKPNRYALETWRKSNRTGEQNPLELQYIDVPNSQLERFRASSIVDPKQVEFEPEDFIIPLDYPRQRIPYPIELYKGMDQFKLLRTDLSKYITSNRRGGKLIPHNNFLKI